MLRMRTVAFLLAISAGTVQAQQSACLERTIPVSISSNDGSPAPELTTTKLEGTYDKKLVVVKSVEIETNRPKIILLVDTSGSIQLHEDALIDAAEAVMSKLPPDAKIGLASSQS